jgi:hypothetical protein
MSVSKKPIDMSAAAQCARIWELLKAGSQTTYSLRSKGISNPAQRIHDLIKAGYLVSKGRVTAVDSDGFQHHGVAIYSAMDREPDLVDQMLA